MNIQAIYPMGAVVELRLEELELLRDVCQAVTVPLLEAGDPRWVACEPLAGAFQALGLGVEGVRTQKIYERGWERGVLEQSAVQGG